MSDQKLKQMVREFWDDMSCGEIYATGDSEKEYYNTHGMARCDLEPYILEFAGFKEGKGKDVLEVGVGMGADHIHWAQSLPRSLAGIDLSSRAVEHTKRRLAAYGLTSHVIQADAEDLPFADFSFDLVYSWGVLHHSPNPARAIDEVYRVLKEGGTAKIMIYHKYSLTAYMLWVRYAFFTGRPLCSMADILSNYLESPGTKAYSIADARKLFKPFSSVNINVQLSFGDLLQGGVGQRHRGFVLHFVKRLWPRPVLRRLFKNHGLGLLIEGKKRVSRLGADRHSFCGPLEAL